VFQKKGSGEYKNEILCSITLFPNAVPFMRQCGRKWQSQTGHR